MKRSPPTRAEWIEINLTNSIKGFFNDVSAHTGGVD